MQDQVISEFAKATNKFGQPIMIAQVGSHAYGLNTPDSDEDYRGVFLPSSEYLFGLKTVEQVRVHGDDWVSHEVRQYCRNVIKQNPTMLELLYVKPLFTTPYWDNFLQPELKKLVCKKAFKPYMAYIDAQIYKMEHRSESSKRQSLIDLHGYDTKAMSHLARLAVQCKFLLDTWAIPVMLPEPYRTDILNIKTGVWFKQTALDYCSNLRGMCHAAYAFSTLPEDHDVSGFDQKLINKFMEYYA